MDYYDNLSEYERSDLEEIILESNVLGIYGYEDKQICPNNTPAGIISSIAQVILDLTLKYLVNENGQEYKQKLETVTYLESMQAIVSYYLKSNDILLPNRYALQLVLARDTEFRDLIRAR